jgi:hypothetical protein
MSKKSFKRARADIKAAVTAARIGAVQAIVEHSPLWRRFVAWFGWKEPLDQWRKVRVEVAEARIQSSAKTATRNTVAARR